jgi:DNA-binding response OmpR family regulator
MHILIAEDEPALRDGLNDLLRNAGYEVESVDDGLDAAERATHDAFDLVILDLGLPRLDGIEVCRRIRVARPLLPILMLTARGTENEKVTGLDAGADDYLVKPFGSRELLARVAALLRRASASPADAEHVEADGCLLDLGHCVAQRDGARLQLTAREAGIIRWLHRHRARAVSRKELLERVWGANGEIDTRTVDMTIANLRQKIERNPASPRIITTVKGVGYAWGTVHPERNEGWTEKSS